MKVERLGFQVIMSMGKKDNNIVKFKREDAYKTLDTINMWINNCDTKSSIFLGIIGVTFSIFLSLDLARKIKNVIESAFANFSGYMIIYNLIIIIGIMLCIIGIIYIVLCIVPIIILNTDSLIERLKKNCFIKILPKFIKMFFKKFISNEKEKRKLSEDAKKSIMFYGSIALKDYTEYKNDIKNKCGEGELDIIMEDLIFQIHSASRICYLKFKRFRKGVRDFVIGFIICIIQLIIGYYCF